MAGGMADAKTGSSAEPQYVAYVPLPDEKEIEARIVERKKAELLARYSTPALQQVRLTIRPLMSLSIAYTCTCASDHPGCTRQAFSVRCYPNKSLHVHAALGKEAFQVSAYACDYAED